MYCAKKDLFCRSNTRTIPGAPAFAFQSRACCAAWRTQPLAAQPPATTASTRALACAARTLSYPAAYSTGVLFSDGAITARGFFLSRNGGRMQSARSSGEWTEQQPPVHHAWPSDDKAASRGRPGTPACVCAGGRRLRSSATRRRRPHCHCRQHTSVGGALVLLPLGGTSRQQQQGSERLGRW
jgi:hypothetical protein